MKKVILIVPVLVVLAILFNPESFLNSVLRAYWAHHGVPFRQVKTDNFSIGVFYNDGGHDRTVLLLHGLGGKAASSWFTIIPELSKTCNVIAPDLLLANLVEGDMPNYSLEYDERLVSELLATLDVGKVTVVGLSVGGWLAGRLAVNNPDLCDRLVLIDSAGLDTDSLLESIANHSNEFGSWFYKNIFYPEPPVPAFLVSPMLKDMDKLGPLCARFLKNDTYASQDLESSLAGISCPTLIVWGAEDRIIPLEIGKRFNQLISNSSLKVLEDCGHAVVWDGRHELPTIINSFVNGETVDNAGKVE